MAPLFSKADLNEFWYDVQNEVTLICAKFGKDRFSVSKVIGRKTKWPWCLCLPCNKKAQLSLTNPRDAKACQKLLQFDVVVDNTGLSSFV